MYSALLLRPKITNFGWIIAGVSGDGNRHILAVLDPPISKELARKVARLIAEQMGIEKIID